MDLDPYVSLVTEQLVAAAALGDERTRQVAAALATSAAGAVRLAAMSAISATADEINAALLDTSGVGVTISVQLENDEPTIRVDTAPVAEPIPTTDPGVDGDASARISLRLPELLKADIDAAANRESISVNTWLVRAARTALNPARPATNGEVRSGRHIRGWVTG